MQARQASQSYRQGSHGRQVRVVGIEAWKEGQLDRQGMAGDAGKQVGRPCRHVGKFGMEATPNRQVGMYLGRK